MPLSGLAHRERLSHFLAVPVGLSRRTNPSRVMYQGSPVQRGQMYFFSCRIWQDTFTIFPHLLHTR